MLFNEPYVNPYGSGTSTSSCGEKVSQSGAGGKSGHVAMFPLGSLPSELPSHSGLQSGVTRHCGIDGVGISFRRPELVHEPESDAVLELFPTLFRRRGDRVDTSSGLRTAPA